MAKLCRYVILATGFILMASWPLTSFCGDAPAQSDVIQDYYSSAGKTPDYYSDVKRGREGFFGYEPIKKKEKPEAKKDDKKVEVAAQAPPPHRLPSLKDYTPEELWSMHPDDFQALYNDFQKKAVMTLKEEDVKEFWYMTDISRRRSLAFANVTAEVMQSTPSLNVAKDYPINTPGMYARVTMQRSSVDNLLKDNRDSYGIIYFYKQGCPYCQSQDGINRLFITDTGWEIKSIDIEKSPMVAAMFGVEQTPSMFLVYKDNTKDYFPISAGVITVDEMKENIYRGMRVLRGETAPQTFAGYDYEKGSSFDASGPLNFELPPQ